MAMIAGDIKKLLSINIKSRHDGFTDQYNRIFAVKVLLVCSMIMGISWFKDGINCIVLDTGNGLSGGFVSSACWIQGVYVYREMETRIADVAYYGIPKDVENDGIQEHNGQLCRVFDKYNKRIEGCTQMTKTFYLQYQWMPFYVAALSILYYLPYVLFCFLNSDLISLKGTLNEDADKADDQAKAQKIVTTYFSKKTNPSRPLQFKVWMSFAVKVLYLIANVMAFYGTNSVLNYHFSSYGVEWANWSQEENSFAHDYMGMRDKPKPGNSLLPPFGFCELYEAAKDNRHALTNKHKFVCEMSQNVLYQYCLLIMWWMFVAGIIMSIIGIIMLIGHYVSSKICVHRQGKPASKVLKEVSFRELEYLECIRGKNLPLYAAVLEKLKESRFAGNNDVDRYQYHPNHKPMYPLLPSGPQSDEKERLRDSHPL